MNLIPGIYKATVRGIPGESIVLVGHEGDYYCLAPNGEARQCYVFENARPLIVLDLLPTQVIGLVRILSDPLRHDWAGPIADQIEAQTKPARIEEPGLGGSVMAGVSTFRRIEYHRCETGWSHCENAHYRWADLIDPVLIRDGVES